MKTWFEADDGTMFTSFDACYSYELEKANKTLLMLTHSNIPTENIKETKLIRIHSDAELNLANEKLEEAEIFGYFDELADYVWNGVKFVNLGKMINETKSTLEKQINFKKTLDNADNV